MSTSLVSARHVDLAAQRLQSVAQLQGDVQIDFVFRHAGVAAGGAGGDLGLRFGTAGGNGLLRAVGVRLMAGVDADLHAGEAAPDRALAAAARWASAPAAGRRCLPARRTLREPARFPASAAKSSLAGCVGPAAFSGAVRGRRRGQRWARAASPADGARHAARHPRRWRAQASASMRAMSRQNRRFIFPPSPPRGRAAARGQVLSTRSMSKRRTEP